jgi:K+-sensing histidine kinase KdpD
VTNKTHSSDPIVDFILGRDGGRLSFASSLGLTFVSCLLLAAATASGIVGGTLAFGAFVVVVVAASWWSSPATAVVLALVGFLFANGFAFDSGGTLVWHGEADLLRLFCLLGLAVTASVMGHREVEQVRRAKVLGAVATRARNW